MKRIIVIVCCFLLFVGANSQAGVPFSTGPQTEEEMFPQRNQNPQLGVVINRGTAHLNLYVYDEAGRLIEQTYLSGANSWLTINDQIQPKAWVRQLKAGRYRMEIYPFYYQTNLLGPLFGQPSRYRIDLPKQVSRICINQNPTDYYCWELGRHFGWILYLNSGYIPEHANGLPGIHVNFQGDFKRGGY